MIPERKAKSKLLNAARYDPKTQKKTKEPLQGPSGIWKELEALSVLW